MVEHSLSFLLKYYWVLIAMKSLLIITLLFLAGCASVPPKPFVQIKPAPTNEAWWLRAEYFPSDKMVAGIPVKKINNDWCAAKVFANEDYIKVLNELEIKELKTHTNIVYELSGKFIDQRNLTAHAGVYQKCSGEKGNFILFTEPLSPQQENLVSVLEANPNAASFMALMPDEKNAINVFWCLDCGDYGVLKWDSKIKNFKWLEGEQP